MKKEIIAPLLIASLVSPGCQHKVKETRRPNILFIMTDDHALAAISAYQGFLAKVFYRLWKATPKVPSAMPCTIITTNIHTGTMFSHITVSGQIDIN